jgi:ATP-dependent DNA helicase DinG
VVPGAQGGGPRSERLEEALDRVVAALPGGEVRSGQVAMARAVDVAIRKGRHLLVEAGTGTGKSISYLLPAVLSGKKVVVATSTKALLRAWCVGTMVA